jgi:PAS domain S-box-containing protein
MVELTAKRKDGQEIPIEMAVSLIRVKDELRTSVIVRDLTARKQVEHDLAASEARYRRLFETAKDGILIVDAKTGKIVDVNPFLTELTGYSHEDFLDKHLWEIGPFKDIPVSKDSFADLQAMKYVRYDDLPLQARDGRRIDVEFVSNVYRADGQDVIQCNIRDITERKRAAAALRQSEDRFRILFERAADSIFLLDLTSQSTPVIQDANSAALRHLGYELHELVGQPISMIDAEPAHAHVFDERRQKVASKLGPVFEVRHRCKDGTILEFECSVAEMQLDSKTLAISVERDITERKRTEAELRLKNLILSTQQEASPDGILVVDVDGKIISSNQRFADMWGISPEIIESRSDERALKSVLDNLEHPEEFASKVRRLYALPDERSADEVSLKDGRIFERNSAPMIGADGRLFGRVWRFRDVTARQRSQEELRASLQLIEGIINTIPMRVFWKDRNLVYLGCNAIFAKDSGFADPKDLIGKDDYQMGWRDQADSYRRSDREVMESGCSRLLVEERQTTPMGGTITLLTSKVPLRSSKGEVVGVLGTYLDITDRKRAEVDRERLAMAIEQAAEIVVVTDARGAIAYVNPAFESVTGYARAEVLGCNPRVLKSGVQDEAFYRTLWETISGGRTWHGRLVNKKKDGTVYTEDATISPVRDADGRISSYVAVKRDITHEISLEAQLLQSQKMEAIGSLAGGVAHDFNNLLSVILSYTEFAMEGVPEGDPLKSDLLEVKTSAKRAVALTRQLLAFSRKQVLQPVPLSLNQTALGVDKMLRRILGEDIDLVQALAPDLGLVQADPGQMEQVLMNLVVNARDAMPDGGKLTIETSNLEIDEEYAARHVAVKPGPYVQLAVTDTGCGMDQETKARLFEPFFTTKEQGKGTGLGLSTVYGIVKQSGGNIWVYSEPGHGTTFKIFLPRELSATAATAIVPPPVPMRTTGTETILVVEDEEALRKVARRSLAAAGYTVLTAANGQEALLTSAQHAGDIHLLLTDVVMPKIGGRALAQELSKARPGLKVVYMSGYADDAIVHHGVLDAGTRFLAKPFTATDLMSKVREVLDGGAAAADGQERTNAVEAETGGQPLDEGALRVFSPAALGKLRMAVIAARYDEIVELVEAIRGTQPAVATGLRRMADLFDYDGLRDLLSRAKEDASER